MPALTDIARLKRLAELFALALSIEGTPNPSRAQLALDHLVGYGLSLRQAEQFLAQAFQRNGNITMRSPEQVVRDVASCFRRLEHGNVLTQVQAVLEAGDVAPEHQELFELCYQWLDHGPTE